MAAWTKRITGKATITVGSVSLDNSLAEMTPGLCGAQADNLAPLLDGVEQGDFDMVAVGRAMIAKPDRPQKIRSRTPLEPDRLDMLQNLD